MNLKKTLSLVLALIMVAATFGAIAIPAAADTVATGTADTSWYDANPNAETFTLMDADDLDGLAKLVNDGICNFDGKTIKLGANIVYNTGIFTAAADGSALYNGQPVSETNMPRVWPVIGAPAMTTALNDKQEADMAKIFHGNFDGCGYEISGLYFDNPTKFRMGLFSVFAGEELKNTLIRNSYLRGNGHVASFIGFAYREEKGGLTLENLYSDATIVTLFNGDIRSAGIIGQTIKILDFVMNRCAYEGNIIDTCADNNGRHRYIAGLIARMDQENEVQRPATISNCLVNATFTITGDKVTNVNRWGGIMGDSRNCGTSGLTINDCLVIINTKIPEVTYGEDGTTPVDFEFRDFGAVIGFTEHKNNITIDDVYAIINSTDVNAENILKAKIGNAVENIITYEGTKTEYTETILTQELAAKIENPSQATDLDATIFLLSEDKAAIKDLNACFSGHSFTELYSAKPASCEGEGWNAHYRCNNCSKFFDTSTNEVAKDTVIIPETHNYGTLVTGTPATCTENGTIDHYKCSLCNRMFDKDKNQVTDLTIVAGHNYGELIRRVKATCVEPGTIAHYQCSVCNKYFDEDKAEVADITIPVTDHDYGRWVEAVAPTPNAAGVLGHYKCGECRKYFDADKNELASIEGEPKLTTTKKPDTTKAPTTTAAEEKGCGGFAAVGSLLALIALTGAAVVIKKK